MSDLKIKATLDAKNTVQGVKDIGKGIDDLKTKAKGADKSLGDMLKQKNSTTNYRRQLMLLQRQIQDLTITYRGLSDAEKRSDFGVEMKSRIDELIKKASDWKDAMADVQESIMKGASDTYKWDAAAQGLSMVSSIGQSVVGVLGLSNDNAKALLKTLTAMKMIEQVVATLKNVTIALQGQSSLMKWINGLRASLVATIHAENKAEKDLATQKIKSKIAEQELIIAKKEALLEDLKRLTVSEQIQYSTELMTALAKKHTLTLEAEVVATKQLTSAQIALKAVKMAGPYALLAAGIGACTVALINASKEFRQMRSVYKDAAKDTGELVSKYRLLQSEWNNLASDDRERWFEENKSAVEDLVGPLDDINKCDKKFNEQSAEVIQNLQKRALLTSAQAKYQEEYTKIFEKYYKKMLKEGDMAYGSKLNEYGINVPVTMQVSNSSAGGFTYEVPQNVTKDIADTYNANLLKELEKDNPFLTSLEDMISELESQISKTEIKTDDENNNDNDDNKTYNALKGSAAYYEKIISEIEDKIKNLVIGTKKWREEQEKLSKLQAEYAAKKFDAMTYEEKKKAYFDVEIKVEDNGIDKVISDFEKSVQDELNDIDWTVGINLDIPPTSLDKVKALHDSLSSLSNISGVYKSFKELSDSIDNCSNGIERLFLVFDTLIEGMGAAINVIEGVNNTMDIMKKLSDTAAASSMKNAVAKGTETAAVEADSTAKGINAILGSMSSVAGIPIVGLALAAAAGAAITALVMSISKKKFASGGIVPGNSFSGDKILAPVNSGEMILNAQQQKNLFNQLNGSSSNSSTTGGDVTFEIKGDRLYGVLKNYTKRRSNA